MDIVPPTQIEKGMLLIATPEIESGIFFRSVLLVCEHSLAGSFGLIINKPIPLELPEEIIDLSEAENKHVSVRAGGPVQTNQMMLLHTRDEPTQQTMEILSGIYLGGNLEFLHELLADETSPYVHLCFGYTSWTSGQLEREILDGHWYAFPGNKQKIFEVPPEKLWRTLLREMGGKYASLSMLPDDLTLN